MGPVVADVGDRGCLWDACAARPSLEVEVSAGAERALMKPVRAEAGVTPQLAPVNEGGASGAGNNSKGTNSNRVVVFRKERGPCLDS